MSADVLRISRSIVGSMLDHALREHPIEACGVVAGFVGSDAPTRWIPLHNEAQSEVFYEVRSDELLALYRQMADLAEDPVVIYHSHTSTAGYPSETDVRLAAEPHAHYVLISTPELADAVVAEAPGPELRSFRIVDGQIAEESIEIF